MTYPKTGGTEYGAAQATPWHAVNDAHRRFDALASRAIIVDRDLDAAPATCVDGANYLVAATPAGGDPWEGQTGKLATAVGANAVNGWLFQTVAVEGFDLYIQDEDLELRYNGSAWVSAAGAAGTRAIAGFFAATPSADETLLLYTAIESLGFAANFAGAYGKIGTNPTASFVLSVYKNPTFTGTLITGGTVIGTITVSTGGAFTFATTGGTSQSLAAGDMLAVKGPTTPDATAACAAFTLPGAV